MRQIYIHTVLAIVFLCLKSIGTVMIRNTINFEIIYTAVLICQNTLLINVLDIYFKYHTSSGNNISQVDIQSIILEGKSVSLLAMSGDALPRSLTLPVYTIDAFADVPFSGNQAAVIPVPFKSVSTKYNFIAYLIF